MFIAGSCSPADAAGDSGFGKFLYASVFPGECALEPHLLGCMGTRLREGSSSLGLADTSTLSAFS